MKSLDKHKHSRQSSQYKQKMSNIVLIHCSYPDDEILYYNFREKCLWEQEKTNVLRQAIQIRNFTHNERNEKPRKLTAKERAKSAQKAARKFL